MFGKISTGALNDLEKVTKQAYAMVAYYGMNKEVGTLSYYDSTGEQEYSFGKPYSEKTSEIIDSEVRKMIEEAYAEAKEILRVTREKLDKLAALLMDKEVMFREDLVEVFGPRPFEEEAKAPEEGKEAEASPESVDEKSSEAEILSRPEDGASIPEK